MQDMFTPDEPERPKDDGPLWLKLLFLICMVGVAIGLQWLNAWVLAGFSLAGLDRAGVDHGFNPTQWFVLWWVVLTVKGVMGSKASAEDVDLWEDGLKALAKSSGITITTYLFVGSAWLAMTFM